MTTTISSDNVVVKGSNLGSDFRTTRNVIHNGDFRVNQRAQSSYLQGTMTLDRWYSSANYGTQYISQQTTTSFPGYFLRASTTGAAAVSATSFNWIAAQQLEGNDLATLGLGTYVSNAKYITVSFWVRSSLTGTSSVMIGVRNSSNTWYYSYRSYSISTANKWEYKSVTFNVSSNVNCPAPTYDSNFSFGIWFVGGIGSNYYSATENTFTTTVYAGTASNVNFTGTLNATFDLARVQVEAGSYPTQFEFIPIAQELERCMRYYQKSYALGTQVGTGTFDGAYGHTWTAQRPNYYASFGFWYTIPLQTRMRTAPTVGLWAPNSGTGSRFSIDTGSYVDGLAYTNAISDSAIQVYSQNPADYGKSGVQQFYGGYIHYRATCDAASS